MMTPWDWYIWGCRCWLAMLVPPKQRGNAAVFAPAEEPKCYRNVDGVMTSIAYLPRKAA